MSDQDWMARALVLAERGVGRTTPNPAVGACVVDADGVLVGHGSTERAGGRHAEVVALDEAGAAARGGTLYCTLEPCAHTGRTGPCTERIVAAGIRRVVAAVQDPDPRVRGRGFARLREAGVVVDVGVGHEPAIRLNQPFFTAVTLGRPFVIAKAATSLDGCVASAPGVRTPITSAPANLRTQHLRARVDAVAVGSGTVLTDDPRLTVREVFRERPLARIVFDRRLRTPPTARLFSTLSAGPVIIVTLPEAALGPRAEALTAAGAMILTEAVPTLRAALERLVPLEIQSVLLEGGPSVHAAAWQEGVVDYVQAFIGPQAFGPGGLAVAPAFAASLPSLVEPCVEFCGPDVSIEGYVHRIG
jgi:diaminohydroxyphosphoribosylaminopyrimidine deaminase/5-amino-6-(5-phosphoribosylamino)uracil reductase